MRPERWSRVRELFERAAELGEPARTRFLEETTGDDPDLRVQVERLLESSASQSFLAPPDPARLAASLGAPGPEAGEAGDPDPQLRPGVELGSYRILHALGRGGMGTVFAAEQDRPRRRVALKVLRDPLAGKDARRRFLVEAELLGRLRHPGIATIYEVGEQALPGGPTVPFFALELVEDARDLIRYAEERPLALRQKLELFREVLAAVHHAHLAGVVHRDLKPDNLLVDAAGRPKVIDYGVACAVDPAMTPTELRSAGVHVVGTLQYMAPEQLRGGSAHLDHRADVYALGLVLYELVAGARPYDLLGRPLAEVLERLASTERDPPSRHRPDLPRELDWICLRAIASEPDARYGSASEFADDLERFLEGEVVSAAPPGALYRAGKFVARNRLPLGVLTLVLGSLLAAVLVTRSALNEARDERDRNAALVARLTAETEERRAALVRLGEVNAELLEAQVGLEQASARTLLELERQRAVTRSLHDLLSAVNPREDGYRVTVYELLERAQPELDRCADKGQQALLSAYYASAYHSLGMQARAEELFRSARAALDQMPDRDPRLESTVDLRLASLLVLTDRLDEAEPLLDASERRLESNPDVELLAELVELRSRTSERRGALEAAAAVIESALAGPLAAPEAPADAALGGAWRARLRSRRGLLLVELGRLTEGVEELEAAWAEGVAARGREHPDTLEIGFRLNQGMQAIGRADEALELQTELCELVRGTYGEHSRVHAQHLAQLMTAHLSAGDPDEALAVGERALDALDLGDFDDHELELTLRANYAIALGMKGRGAEAVVELERVVTLLEDGGQAVGPRMFDVRQNLAEALFMAGRLDDSLAAFEDLLFLAREVHGDGSWQEGLALARLGMTVLLAGNADEGLDLIRSGRVLLADTTNELGLRRRQQVEASLRALAGGLQLQARGSEAARVEALLAQPLR